MPRFCAATSRGGAISGLDAQQFLALCREHEIEGLCFERLSQLDSASTAGWPRQVWEELSDAARTRAAEELLRKAEIRRVVAALADAGIRPILLKGTPLAYTMYRLAGIALSR